MAGRTGVTIPDTRLARAATELIRERTSDLVYNHSRRVFCDVLGVGYHDISDADRAAIVALPPRPDFKRQILQAFTDGMADRPDATFGTVNADVLERFAPGFKRGNFVDLIEQSDWPD
jgi:hypothetical protein